MTDQKNSSQPAGNSTANISSDVLEHAAELMESAPEVQEHVVAQQAEAANAASAGAENSSEVRVDKFGVKFDPAKHTGSLLKSGAWRERKVSGSTLNVSKKKRASVTIEGTTEGDAQSAAAGVAAAQSLIAVCTMAFGAEWQPLPKAQIGYDENEMMGKAFGDYFKAKGVTDFPPGATLACVLLAYAGLRFRMPETQKKVGGIKNWFGLRFAKWKVQREFKKRGITAIVTIKNGELLFDGKPESEFAKK